MELNEALLRGEGPTLGKLEFEGVGYRWGKMLNPETGEYHGIVLEFWFPVTPWFKFRIPFERLVAVDMVGKLMGLINEEQNGADNEA